MFLGHLHLDFKMNSDDRLKSTCLDFQRLFLDISLNFSSALFHLSHVKYNGYF